MSSPLVQTTLLDALDKAKAPSAAPKAGRKRTLTLVNGSTVDIEQRLSSTTPDVVEAMRLRIIQLEDELAARPPPAKRARASAPSKEDDEYKPEAPVAAAPSKAEGKKTAAADKAFDKKVKTRVKKIYDQLKKGCKAADVKFQGRAPKTIKVDEILEPDEFDAIFKGKGILIQPTPKNKPGSTVTIIHFPDMTHLQALFGDELKPLKGSRWNVGGGRFFAKSTKLGPCDVNIERLEVSYSKNTSKATLKFEVQEAGVEWDGLGMDDYW